MPIREFKYETIDLVNLLLDVSNPRFETQPSQREALRTLVVEQGLKLLKLAEHMARYGPNPSEMPIVIKSKGNGQYTVLEGNRRIAAIKLCTEPQLVDSLGLSGSIAKRLKSLNAEYGSSLPLSLQCAVAPGRKQANMWIELRHTGERGGIGIISWSGVAASRFRGQSPEIQLLEHVKDSVFLDAETRDKLPKMSITNLQRLLRTPEARQSLGIRVTRSELRFLNPDDRDEALGRMAIVVSDIANKYIKVTQLDSKDQRVEYANAVAARDLPTPGDKITPTKLTTTPASKATSKKRGQKSADKDRATLIPKKLKLNITQARISRIFDEMKRLKLNNFENSCAVLLRVFLEMSLVEYSKKHKIPLVDIKKKNKSELTLKKKVVKVADYLESNGICGRNELYGIRSLAKSKNTVFSIDTWHNYVHNQHYSPSVKELITNWDNIQPFFEKVWA